MRSLLPAEQQVRDWHLLSAGPRFAGLLCIPPFHDLIAMLEQHVAPQPLDNNLACSLGSIGMDDDMPSTILEAFFDCNGVKVGVQELAQPI